MEPSEKNIQSREVGSDASTAFGMEHVPETETAVKEIRIGERTLVLLVGLPASGKSTFAEENFPIDAIVSTDAIRGELTNNPRNQLVSNRAFIMAKRILEERLARGEIAVMDAQNLGEDNRQQFYEIAQRCDARVEAVFFRVPIEEIMERDRSREKSVGDAYLKQQKTAYRTALASLRASPHLSAVHVVEPHDHVSVELPAAYQESFKADQDLREAAEQAEIEIIAAETDPQREDANVRHMLPIEAGSVLFVSLSGEQNDSSGEVRIAVEHFIEENFLQDQVVDANRIARRLATQVDDEAVRDIAQYILKERIQRNLTTVVRMPESFPYGNELRETIRLYAEKNAVAVPTPAITVDAKAPSLETAERIGMENPENSSFAALLPPGDINHLGIEVIRNAPDDVPLFFVGDTHGCRRAVGELANRIRRENLEKSQTAAEENSLRESQKSRNRKIVFVGDMGDRGPYDAETVIYITALVRSGRAMLVRGNHDENLLHALKGEDVKSGDTRRTAAELQKRLMPKSLQKIINIIEQAPYIAEWQTVVAAHGALPRIPRKGEVMKEEELKVLTHGAKSGRFTGRAEVHKLHATTAKDPGILAVAGHTHETKPVLDTASQTANVDVSAQVMGRLYGLYYPELQFVYAEEPEVLKLYKILEGRTLPEGELLLDFIDYAERQGYIQTKEGQGTYQGLTLASYSEVTELTNAWETYPVLRHFRGLIVDGEGNVVARPFEKTHKVGEEIPLEKLEHIMPDKVFEKANGSLGIAYHWKGAWRFATKFSFENEAYTKRASAMFTRMDQRVLDPAYTYLFEIILPEDPHIVDYGGREDLLLLNAIETKTGRMAPWDGVEQTAKDLGASTAKDMTDQFAEMSVAEIYRHAQQEGKLKNLEGMMALYHEPDTGKETLVKVKVREYSDKKFVRDHMDWEYLLKAIDPKTLDVVPHEKERLLRYNTDNRFARAALDARIQWIGGEYQKIADEMHERYANIITEASSVREKEMTAHGDLQRATKLAMQYVHERLAKFIPPLAKGEHSVIMGFIREQVTHAAEANEQLFKHALTRIIARIQDETKRRGRNAFWIIPDETVDDRTKDL